MSSKLCSWLLTGTSKVAYCAFSLTATTNVECDLNVLHTMLAAVFNILPENCKKGKMGSV